MGQKVELSSVLSDLDSWSTGEMLVLRGELIRRLKQSDELQTIIRSMARELAMQEVNNLPEVRVIQSEISCIQEENNQHKEELKALKAELQLLKEEHARRNAWLQDYIQRVQHGETELEQLEKVLPWDMLGRMESPSGIEQLLPSGVDWENIEWINTQVGISLFLRNSGNPRNIRVWTVKGVFDGQLEEAFDEIVPQILYAIFRIPSISDFSGKPEWLDDKEALIILKALAYFKYLKPEKFNDQRLAIFNRFWSQKKDRAYNGVRKNAMDSFTKFVERTFKQREERVSQSIISF